MSILNNFLIKNCTVEQSSLLIKCFETLSKIGLVEIDFNIDNLLGRLEEDDLFTIIQTCYEKIRTFQKLAFDELELEVDNFDDIGTSSDILYYLDQLEDHSNSQLITAIIDNSPTPEDALLAIFEQVLFADLNDILPILQNVPASLIERLYEVHQSDFDLVEVNNISIKELDQRKVDRLMEHWSIKEINSLKHYILENSINLPIKKSVWMKIKKAELVNQTFALDKKRVASKLLEGCLVMNVQWKDIKRGMKQLAAELFEDVLYKAELSYEIDNICMRSNISEQI